MQAAEAPAPDGHKGAVMLQISAAPDCSRTFPPLSSLCSSVFVFYLKWTYLQFPDDGRALQLDFEWFGFLEEIKIT